jgi:hypothetical protein
MMYLLLGFSGTADKLAIYAPPASGYDALPAKKQIVAALVLTAMLLVYYFNTEVQIPVGLHKYFFRRCIFYS